MQPEARVNGRRGELRVHEAVLVAHDVPVAQAHQLLRVVRVVLRLGDVRDLCFAWCSGSVGSNRDL